MKNAMIFLLMGLFWACTPKMQPVFQNAEVKKDEVASTVTSETFTHTIPGTEVSFEMALIPGGIFKMGSPVTEAGRKDDEGPQAEVKLEPFWIGVYELSYEAYNIFREKELDKVPTEGKTDWNPDAVTRPSPPYDDPTFGMGKEQFPAVSMTQFAALQYCRWLSEKTGVFFRLPTEAEWEYACRAGTKTAYSFGDDPTKIDEYAWHEGNSGEKYHELGGKKPNAWGLFDMHGNVAEWTLDEYETGYFGKLGGKATPVEAPWVQPTRLHPRTVKGGSWDDPADMHRCACRVKSSSKWQERDPQIPKSFWWNTDSPFVGLRLVSPKKQPSKEELDLFWLMVLGD